VPNRDTIVIGASAGGVEALREIARHLAPDLPAAIFVVIHLYPRSTSNLPEILSRSGPLSAVHPQNGTAIEHGRIYVAPPDHHLIIEPGHVHLGTGPREQRQRPCINVTFRSAANAYGERVIGVLLTGQLDDGVAGLWHIKRHGGVAVVQNPEEAMFPSMPLSALREIETDYTLPVADMGSLFQRLISEDGTAGSHASNPGSAVQPNLTDITCPDCRGTIWEVPKGRFKEYRCRIGHTYSPKSMLAEHFAAQEKAIYAAIVALEEGAWLATRLSEEVEPETGERLRKDAREREMQAAQMREMLKERMSFSLD
jgi:two-component system, chemotaxis family, protein-glutamate methylesterase/glutaminase